MLILKKLLHKMLMAIPRKVSITGTTSASGALQIPSAYQTKPLFGAYREGSPSTMIYRRDAAYLMVMNASNGNTFTAYANQNVTINAWTIG